MASSSTTSPDSDPRLEEMFKKIDQGVEYFDKHHDEDIQYISTALDYSAEDAREWLKTVRFATNCKGVDVAVIQKTVDILKKAFVLGEAGMKPEVMIASQRGAQVP